VPRIADKARSEGIQLTEASYTILMQALGEAGGADQAVACLDTMVCEGLQPNVSKRPLSDLTWYRVK
jgi:pentatricopeptide repeat protein